MICTHTVPNYFSLEKNTCIPLKEKAEVQKWSLVEHQRTILLNFGSLLNSFPVLQSTVNIRLTNSGWRMVINIQNMQTAWEQVCVCALINVKAAGHQFVESFVTAPMLLSCSDWCTARYSNTLRASNSVWEDGRCFSQTSSCWNLLTRPPGSYWSIKEVWWCCKNYVWLSHRVL